MSPGLVQRQLALAGVALLAGLGTLALGRADAQEGAVENEPVPRASGSWYVATVGSYGPGFFGRTTPCNVRLTAETRGIAHPVLPCGVKIVLAHRGREVETEVIDKGPYSVGHEFDLTQALAAELGIRGRATIRWRFAGAAG